MSNITTILKLRTGLAANFIKQYLRIQRIAKQLGKKGYIKGSVK
jgi:hypothetical protein